MALPTIFKRGGQKKELFAVTSESQDVEELNKKLGELQALWAAPRTSRDMCAAIWREDVCAAEIVVERGNVFRCAGFTFRKKRYLHIEEAVFLADCGVLLLYSQLPGSDEPSRQLLSLQEAFQLMAQIGVPLEQYVAYSSLCKRGYIVARYPTCFTVPPQQTPASIWGTGAWAACYSGTPSTQLASTAPAPTPLSTEPPPATAASAAQHPDSSGPGRPPSGSITLTPPVTNGTGTAADVHARQGTSAAAAISSAPEATPTPGAGSGPTPASTAVEEPTSTHPAAAATAAAAPSPAAQPPPPPLLATTPTPASTSTLPPASIPLASAPAAPGTAGTSLPLSSGQASASSQPTPGPLPPGASLFLAYDVYKPSSSFSRRNPPPRMCTLCVCTPGRLPCLPDWWGLVQQSGGSTPVRFAVADYGDILFYDFGSQPIPSLCGAPK